MKSTSLPLAPTAARTAAMFVGAVATLFLAFSTPAAEPTKLPLERMKYNHPGLVVDLGVGLWGWPLPIDYDGDGDKDLIVSCSDVPYNGTYLFENPGGDAKMPVFKPPVKVAGGIRNLGFSVAGGRPRVMVPGAELTKVFDGDFQTRVKRYPSSKLVPGSEKIRANQWGMVDFNGDGVLDLFAGHGLWTEYGWDNAFNDSGDWIRGPLRGYVYVITNRGTTAEPDYQQPMQLQADGKPVDVYGMPSPELRRL